MIDLETAKRDYARDGFAIFRNAIGPDVIAEARGHIDWLQSRHPTLRPEHFHHPLMLNDAFWVRLVTDPALVAIAQVFLGTDIACFTSHYISKPPHDGQAVLWHQDGAYWNLQPMEALTIWLAVDDSDCDNGCLRMIPRSHTGAMRAVVKRDDVPNMLFSSVDPCHVDESDAVDIQLKAGDVSVHHPLIVHGSEANRSARRRCGLDIGYIRATTRIGDTGLYLNPILVAGEPVAGVNTYRPWPHYDPAQSIPFQGCDGWNALAAARNERVHARATSEIIDVDAMTATMIERLQTQTTSRPLSAAAG